MIKKYLAFARTSIKELNEYKAEFLASAFFVYPITIIVSIIVWRLVYSNLGVDSLGGFTLNEIIFYSILVAFIEKLIRIKVSRTSKDIQSGILSRDLCRPYSHNIKRFIQDITKKGTNTLFALIPLIIAIIILKLQIPKDPINIILTILALINAIILVFAIVQIMAYITFWFKANFGFGIMMSIIMDFMSGRTLPISIFPSWFQTISNFLPFQSLKYIPVSILLNKFTHIQALEYLLIGIAWTILFIFIAKFMWKKGLKEYEAQGG